MTPELSVVIPAYNEAERLPATLGRMREYLDRSAARYEVIVVDDGSQDQTVALTREMQRHFPQLQIVSNGRNRGKGYSVRRGFLEARGSLLLLSDADLSSPVEELEKLREALGRNDAAIGSRSLSASQITTHQPLLREFSGKCFNRIMRLATGLEFHDTQCGFKLFRREPFLPIFEALTMDGFAFDVEILYLAHRSGLRIVEVPVRWANVEGTRVGLLPGLQAFADLLKIRRRHRDWGKGRRVSS